MEFDFAHLMETLAAAVPEREAIVHRDRRLSYADLEARSRRLASYFHARGLRVHRERSELAGHESGQDHVGLYLYNGPEYVEAMFGAWKARAAHFNVNYRYVEEELLYLLDNAQARGLVYHAEFAPRLAAIRDSLPQLEVLIQVADDSGNALLPGAVDYEEVMASSPAEAPPVEPSPDDLYLLYTGGTTGMPKGVLWRSHDIFVAAMGGRKPDGSLHDSYESIAELARSMPPARTVTGPPLMHGAAQWSMSMLMTMGQTIVFPDEVKRFDADDFLRTVERERAAGITIVGDAFARPLLDRMRKGDLDLSSLKTVGSGGAPLSRKHKEEFLELLPDVLIFDGMGSSEAGAQAMNVSTRASGASTGRFDPGAGAVVLSEDLSRVLDPSDTSLGWLARSGPMPLGYLGDPEKTAKTFPTIDGVRYSVPGDRARYRPDGSIELLGRDSACINSGGEKIFAEEVELALKQHPDVFDVLVAGRPSERWGQEVVAVVQLREGAPRDEAALLAEAERHIARYKLPKAFVFVDRVQRSPSGKADYRWAKQQAERAAA